MFHVRRAVRLAVRTVVESLEDRRLLSTASIGSLASVNNGIFLPVTPSGLNASDMTTTNVALQNLMTPDADETHPLSVSASGGVATFKLNRVTTTAQPLPLEDGWYDAYVRRTEATFEEAHAGFGFLNADFDGDGGVSIADFNTVAGNFGKANPTFADGDANYDGVINIKDYNILSPQFGKTLPALPTEPGDLEVAAVNELSLDVTWVPIDEPRIGFKIYRSDDGGQSYTMVHEAEDVAPYKWTDTNVLPDTKYWYRVRSYTEAGASASITRDSAIPFEAAPLPSGLWAQGIGDGNIWVEWEPATNKPVAHYRVYRGTTPDFMLDSPSPIHTTTDGTLTQYTDPGRAIGVTYYYTVIAEGVNGRSSPPLPPVAATVENQAPVITGGNDLTTDTTTATVAVTATDDGYAEPLTYTWSIVSKPDGADDPTFADASSASTLVTFGKAGYYELGVTVSDGDLSTDYTVGVDVQQKTGSLSVGPQTVSIEPGRTQQFLFTATDQFGDDYDGPVVEWETNYGSIDPHSGEYTSPKSQPNEAIKVKVKADGKSAEATVTLTPVAPGNVQATLIDQKTANFTWADSASTEVGYLIEASANGGEYTKLVDAPANATGWTTTGLAADTSYQFRISTVYGDLRSDPVPMTGGRTPKDIGIVWSHGIEGDHNNPSTHGVISGGVPGVTYDVNFALGLGGSWDGSQTIAPGSNPPQTVGPDYVTLKYNDSPLIDHETFFDPFNYGNYPDTLDDEDGYLPYQESFTGGSTATIDVSTELVDPPPYDGAVSDEGWNIVGPIFVDPRPEVNLSVIDDSAWEVPLESTAASDNKLVFRVGRSPNVSHRNPYDLDDQGGQQGEEEPSPDYSGSLTVYFHPPAGYAVDGNDYHGIDVNNPSITIEDGNAYAEITLTAVADANSDPNETVELSIKGSTAYRLGSFRASGTINDIVGNIGFNNDNGPASDPENKLLPGTPDAGFVIDADDDKTEDQGEGFRFWRDNAPPLTLDNVTSLAPFTIDVPSMPANAGSFWLKVAVPAGSPDFVTVYNNPGASRLTYLSDSPTATKLVNSDFLLFSAEIQEQKLLDLAGEPVKAGHHEFLVRCVQPEASAPGPDTVVFTLEFRPAAQNGASQALDSAKVTFDGQENFYSVLSSRDENAKTNFDYPTDQGRTQNIQRYMFDIKRDKRDTNVKKTAVFVHGYNVSPDEAEKMFATTYQRMFWQGFRGNFVGWDWDGWQPLTGAFMFSENVERALHTSPALWTAIRGMMLQPATAGGWGLGPQDIDIVAHSLGNVVMWDALRINAAKTPKKLVHNVTSIEAAIFQEAFDPVGPLSYNAPFSALMGGMNYAVNETVDQQQQSGWRSWFNPSGRNIKSSVSGKVINSYNPGDEVLELMRKNEKAKYWFWEATTKFQATANRRLIYKTPPVYRSAENLGELRTYVDPGGHITRDIINNDWDFETTDINHAIGTRINPMADVDIDASTLEWGQSKHSDFKDLSLPNIWPWWFRAIKQEQAVATGIQ